MAGLIPFYELIPQEAFPEYLVRNLLLFDAVLPGLRSDKRYIDFPSLFAERVKMPYRTFCALALAVTVKPMLADQLGGLLGDDFLIPPTYLSKTTFPPEYVKRFLALIATDYADLRRSSPLWSRGAILATPTVVGRAGAGHMYDWRVFSST